MSEKEQMEKLAELLDAKFKLPFGISFGYDTLIGLIPGIGDLISSGLSFYIILAALYRGASLSVILNMLFNVLIDFLIGLVPFLGDFTDIFWKANLKNVRIMESYFASPQKQKRNSVLVLLGAFLFFVLLMSLFSFVAIYIFFSVITWVFS